MQGLLAWQAKSAIKATQPRRFMNIFISSLILVGTWVPHKSYLLFYFFSRQEDSKENS